MAGNSFKTAIAMLGARFFLSFYPIEVFAQDKMTMVKVADNVYMTENSRGSGNSTFVITDEGVVVFDADIRTSDQTLAAIRKLTDKKVRYIITSHSAGDHATGGWYFREDRPVYIATRNQVRDLFMQEAREFEERKASDDPRHAVYKGKELVRPDIGFDGTMTLYLEGSRRAEALFCRHAGRSSQDDSGGKEPGADSKRVCHAPGVCPL